MTPLRLALIALAGIAGAGIVAGVGMLLFSPSTQYRDCAALMWDRKHPAEVKRRQEEARLRACEEERLRYGQYRRDCSRQEALPPGYTSMDSGLGEPLGGWPPNPCEHLSLEELRRADAEANRDKPPR